MRFIIAFTLSLLILSCARSNSSETQEIINKMHASPISFPQEMVFQIGSDTLGNSPLDSEYKIITYIDSIGCSICKMRLARWTDIMPEFISLTEGNIELIMIVNSSQSPEYMTAIKDYGFNHPISFDSKSLFKQNNYLSSNDNYNTFLVDSNDSIVVIGNPATNPKIKKLYERVLSDTYNVQPHNHRFCENNSRILGAVRYGDSNKSNFLLKAENDSIFTISDIIPSCDCIAVKTNSDSVHCDANTIITTYYTPKHITPGKFTHYVDVFFNELEQPTRLYLTGYTM